MRFLCDSNCRVIDLMTLIRSWNSPARSSEANSFMPLILSRVAVMHMVQIHEYSFLHPVSYVSILMMWLCPHIWKINMAMANATTTNSSLSPFAFVGVPTVGLAGASSSNG